MATLQDYFTFEMVYLWTTFGVLPFWLMLIFIPNHMMVKVLINSIILPLILAIAYSYVAYQIVIEQSSFTEFFDLYRGLENLYVLFSNENFLLVFWLHFLAINLFIGSWLSRDAAKLGIAKKLAAFPLIIIYFCGPLGLVLYWFLRIFYSKKLTFYD